MHTCTYSSSCLEQQFLTRLAVLAFVSAILVYELYLYLYKQEVSLRQRTLLA